MRGSDQIWADIRPDLRHSFGRDMTPNGDKSNLCRIPKAA